MGMNDLPSDISLNIFSRLDVDSLLDSKLVCKPWCNLVRNPSFAQTHLSRQKLLLSPNACVEIMELGFLLLEKIDDKSDNCKLHYVGCDVGFRNKSYQMKTKTINIPHIKQKSLLDVVVVDSCNGLICSTVPHHQQYDPIHICNPVTREFVYLPRYENKTGSLRVYGMQSGFGYCPSTNEYKVVRIYHKGASCFFQVYRLGNESTHKWSDEKQIPYPLFYNVHRSKGVSVNGEIHWLDGASKIVSFSLKDEEFHYIASPPPLVEAVIHILKINCVLGNWLCVNRISTTKERSQYVVDIWLFKKNNEMNGQHNGTWNWNKEFTLQAETRSVIPLAFTNDGKVLFSQGYGLAYYDPKECEGLLVTLGRDDHDRSAGLTVYEATRHVNIFVSLKALGVKSKRRLQYKGK